ncbi:MAG: signal peptidase I [Acidimicrobiales bacterium]
MTDAREASKEAENLGEPFAPLVPAFPMAAADESPVHPTEEVGPAADAPRPISSKSPGNRGLRRHLFEWVVVIVFAVLVAGGLRTFVVQAFYVPSGSMLPTLQIGDRIVVIKFGYTIHRGDIVVFKRPPQDVGTTDTDLVKRVIGLPGETISSRGSTVLIDGRSLEEPWLPTLTGSCAESAENIPLTKIAQAHYFVMGDCRGNSADSRSWGTLPGSLVVGKVLAIVWRFGHPYLHWF